MSVRVLLLVPCFNESDRLNLKAFDEGIVACAKSGIELSFLFSNDGSSDQTQRMLDTYCLTSGQSSFHAVQNLGKGNVLQSAYQNKKSLMDFKSYQWIGYWDADLATPFEEIPRMLKFKEFYNSEVASIWCSRISRLGSKIVRQMHRHYLSRIFVTVVSNVLNVKAYDSQCGAKLFTPEAAEIAFKEPFISRWIFDVEILLRLKEEKIIEFPLFNWEDVPGSKVKIVREMLRVAKDLLKIKKQYS